MTTMLSRLGRITGLLFAVSVSTAIAQQQPVQRPASIESLTLKEVISRFDQVDFDLQGLNANVEEFRKDFSHGLGNAAAIRVLDIGVGLVRDRVMLNRMPQVIGAMQRESRTDSWQRSRQEEQMKRQRELMTRHGALNRIVEGYADDLKSKFGIDLKGFLQALQSASDRGVTNLESVIEQYRNAVSRGDANAANSIATQLGSAPVGSFTPQTPPPTAGHGPADIRNVSVDPNDPSRLIITFADGTTVSVPYTRGPNGELVFTLPNGQQVTLPTTTGPDGSVSAMLPNGASVSVPGVAPSGGSMGSMGAGTTGGGMGGMGGMSGALPEGVRRMDNGMIAVRMADGTERYFPADLTKPGIGTRYLGERGTRLIEETEEFLDLSQGGSYQIRKGSSIRWQFAITPTGQSPDAGGTRASFRFSDRTGQGRYTVSGWRVVAPDGSQVGSGAGEEASVVVSQSGTYKVEFAGTTELGSSFRIEAQVPIAVQ